MLDPESSCIKPKQETAEEKQGENFELPKTTEIPPKDYTIKPPVESVQGPEYFAKKKQDFLNQISKIENTIGSYPDEDSIEKIIENISNGNQEFAETLRDALNDKREEKKTAESLKIPSGLREELPRSIFYMGKTFSDINDERFNPLLDDSQIQSLNGITNALRQILAEKNIDTNKLASLLFNAQNVFEEIGRMPRREPRRGESEFLIEARRSIGYFLNNIKDINESAKSFEDEKDEKKLTAITNQIIDTLESKGHGIVNLIGKLQELGY